MDIFGIGPLEFLFVIIIILLIAGPRDIAKGARALGRGLNRLYRSANYQMIRRVSQEIRNLPARLAEEAQLEELKEVAQLKELKEAEAEVKQAARDISQANKQEMEAWVKDLDAPGAAQPRQPGTPSANPPIAPANTIGGTDHTAPAAAPSPATQAKPDASPTATPANTIGGAAPSLAATKAVPGEPAATPMKAASDSPNGQEASE